MASFDASRPRRILAAALLVLGLVIHFAQQRSSAEPMGADAMRAEQETAKLVSEMVPKFHLSRQKVDDRVSSLLLDRFLNDIDPQKMYFLQSDIKEFEPHRTTLDDDLRAGRLDFPFAVFKRYQQRFGELNEVAQYWIDQPHDFTVEEYIETDGKKQTWAASKEELAERWRKRIKFDLLQFKLDEPKVEPSDKEGEQPQAQDPSEQVPQTMAQARERLHRRYQNNKRVVDQYSAAEELEVFLTAFTNCYDPHSTYMSPISSEDFAIQMRLHLDGIGALLGAEDGYTVVKEVIPGGAAADDGRLKEGDRIVGVGQEEGPIQDIFETKLQEVVRLIRGPRGTVVRLQIKPKDGTETKILSLTRKKVELKDAEVKGEIIETTGRTGRPGRIGVIHVPSFYHDFEGSRGGADFKNVTTDVARVLDQFNRDKVDVVVIDLRDNGGGALDDAVKTSGHFIDRGPVVQVKEPSGQIQELNDEESGVRYAGPLIVLCNRLSASASEIFAGVIKDYRRGIIIGDTTTHGKGTVQNLMELSSRRLFSQFSKSPPQGTLKLTISQFYRVNGDSTQNRGVRSDIVIPSLIDHFDLGEEFLDNALPFDQIRPARYSQGRLVSPEMISALSQNSAHRIAENSEFQKVNRRIERYLTQKSRTRFSLNEAERRREIEENKEAQAEEKTADGEDLDTRKSNGPIFPDRFYENEVLNIALDYRDILSGKFTAAK